MQKYCSTMTVFVALVALLGGSSGCDDGDCIACGLDGCPTMEQALDAYGALINCCSGLNLPDDRAEWEHRWRHVPVALLDQCISSVTCTDGPLTCSDRNEPFTWGDQEAMDACMRALVDSGTTSCSDGMLKILVEPVGCMEVDCAAYCGDLPGGCAVIDGQADCGCGFLMAD